MRPIENVQFAICRKTNETLRRQNVEACSKGHELFGSSPGGAIAMQDKVRLISTQSDRRETMKLHFSLASFNLVLFLCLVVTGCGAYGSTGVDGLYYMTRTQFPSGLETATCWFHNGTVVYNPVDWTKFDVPAERASHPQDVGTYSVQGGQLVVAWPGGEQWETKLDPYGNFFWNNGNFLHVKIFKPGTTLDGTFSGGVSVGGGEILTSNTITFKRDGTYESGGQVSVHSEGDLTSVTGGSVGAEHGKYRIDGMTLHLMPEGGKETVVSTFPFGDDTNGPALRLYFNGRMLTRAQ
jgi:hypothetical protein